MTGTRVANRSALDTAVPVDVVSAEQLQNLGVTEINQALSARPALVQLSATRPRRRHRHDPPRDAARPRARSDAGAGQRQAPPCGFARQRQRHDRPRLVRRRPQHDSDRDRAIDRSAARRRVGAVRLRCDRRRDQPAPARSARRRRRERHLRLARLELRRADRHARRSLRRRRATPLVRAADPVARRFRRRNADRFGLERSAARRIRLRHASPPNTRIRSTPSAAAGTSRRQYPLLPGNAFDPREATFDRFNSWYGEPELEQKTVFVNAGYDFATGAHMYGWASWQDRDAQSAGFYRLADDPRTAT